MARMEEVELTNMCMVCDGKGNVLVQNKKVIAHGMDGIFPADTWNRANLSHRPWFARSGRKRAL